MKSRVGSIVLLAALTLAAQSNHWVVTWGTAEALIRPDPPPQGFHNQTIRMVARVSIGGQRVRVKVSNSFGNAPVTLGKAHLALRARDSAIVKGSDRALTFSGQPGCILSPGVTRVSDPVDLNVPASGELAVSL